MKMRVLKVEKVEMTRIVYNFSVQEDESYILNGLVSHNCRCALAPATSDLIEPDPDYEAEKIAFEEWLNV